MGPGGIAVRGGLMVCGTSSHCGKSHVVTGLCRLLARRGVRVAPFKAQNMALNSFVTPSGHEIGRAQGVQAIAAGALPEVAMNPVLLKPTGERSSQVVVMGKPIGHMDAASYHALKPSLAGVVLGALEDLRSRYDVVICEGAGSPAEINLSEHDIVNTNLAVRAGFKVILVGDIDRGGVFASLYGTVALLEGEHRSLVGGFLINKLRGDPDLMGEGPGKLETRCGVPTLGVIPFIHDVALDAEDSLSLQDVRPRSRGYAVGDTLDVAVVHLPRISNFTDLDALALERAVVVRLVGSPEALGSPDLVVLPGTKSTVADLGWMRDRGFDAAINALAERGCTVIGICGGYQILGRRIVDEVESGRGLVEGLGLLDVTTMFSPIKITRQRRGFAMGKRIQGYEVRHGMPRRGDDALAWVHLDDAYGAEEEGAQQGDGLVLGTSLHGILENDGLRSALLGKVGLRGRKRFVPAGVRFAAAREAQIDRLADVIEANVDMAAVERLIAAGAGALQIPPRLLTGEANMASIAKEIRG